MKVIVDNKEIELEIANSFLKRLKGFMFQNEITKVLRFKTNSIHTIFMKVNLDIVMTDKNNKILYIYQNFGKGKILIKKSVYYTYEFPNNFINNLHIGETLIVKE